MSGLSYADAMAAIRAEFEPAWVPSEGTFYVSPDGRADATHYAVPFGAREWLVDEDPAFAPDLNDETTLVRRDTGQLESVNISQAWDKLEAMRPVTA